jgi:two-component system aerobic respiration control sensor histidine kinase ArcB
MAPTSPPETNASLLAKISDMETKIKQLKSEYEKLQVSDRNKEIYLFNILEADLPVTFYWVDKNGTVLGCNHMQAVLYGINSAAELIGKDIYYLGERQGWDRTICDKVRANDLEVMRTGQSIPWEEEAQIGGEKKVFLSYKNPLVSEDGKILGVFGFSVDITERKKAELALKNALKAAEAASEAKTEFIRNMSHDLRTPLSGIIGMADMISHAPEAAITKEGAHDIHQAGVALLNLLNEIIETTQLESANITHQKSCFSLKQIVDTLTSIFNPTIKQKKLALETYYDDNIPDVLFGQALLLHRIILNLFSNAVKFTSKGSISLEVSLLQKREDNVSLKIILKDTGIGIPADKLETIFEKFSRLDPSYSNHYKGSGLGLYMVKQFIKKLGGDIKVDSTLGKGSQFTCIVQFKIPTLAQMKKYKKTHDTQSATVDEQPVSTSTLSLTDKKQPLRVLLVEDTLLPRKVATNLLIDSGCSVSTAETATEAIEKSLQESFDIIYMDIGLPDGNGIDVTKQIRQNPNNPNAATYIAVLTAHSDPEVKKNCLNAGAQIVLDKPLTEKGIQTTDIKIQEYANLQKEELPLFDLSSMAGLMGGNTLLAKEMFSAFMKTLPKIQQDITHSFQQHDWKKLKYFVHSLHGELCYTGALRLKEVTRAFEMELIKQSGDYDKHYQRLMQTIKVTIDHTRSF